MVDFMEPWLFSLPTKVLFGSGLSYNLKEEIGHFNAKKVLFFTGKQSMKNCGVFDRIVDGLGNVNLSFWTVSHSPTVDSVEDAIASLNTENIDLVICLGGGSVIDFAKSVAFLKGNRLSLSAYSSHDKRSVCKGLPVIAIPTTAGSGSEVTPYASITDEANKKKFSLFHEYIRPNLAVVDPALSATLPSLVTASTGLDALSQCIEAYWSKNHTPISDLFALEGIKLIFKNLAKAYQFPDQLQYRRAMSLASMFSGVAIGIAKTTIVHSVSYPLTVHFRVPHGVACSLMLPSFIRYNSKSMDGRIGDIARIVGAKSSEDFALKVEDLVSQVGLPTCLGEVGVTSGDIDLIVKDGFRPDRAGNNPREVTSEDLKNILENLLR